MTASRKVVKKRIVVRRKNTSHTKYTPPKLPESPPVSQGPKSYGLTKKGWHIVPRFFLSQLRGLRFYKDRWWVMDMLEGRVAKGTAQEGYRSKKEAISVAKKYRERYGEWARTPF